MRPSVSGLPQLAPSTNGFIWKRQTDYSPVRAAPQYGRIACALSQSPRTNSLRLGTGRGHIKLMGAREGVEPPQAVSTLVRDRPRQIERQLCRIRAAPTARPEARNAFIERSQPGPIVLEAGTLAQGTSSPRVGHEFRRPTPMIGHNTPRVDSSGGPLGPVPFIATSARWHPAEPPG